MSDWRLGDPEVSDLERELAPVLYPRPVRESGKLVIEYEEAIIERDEQGRILRITGDGYTQSIFRDKDGRPIKVVRESETETPA